MNPSTTQGVLQQQITCFNQTRHCHNELLCIWGLAQRLSFNIILNKLCCHWIISIQNESNLTTTQLSLSAWVSILIITYLAWSWFSCYIRIFIIHQTEAQIRQTPEIILDSNYTHLLLLGIFCRIGPAVILTVPRQHEHEVKWNTN